MHKQNATTVRRAIRLAEYYRLAADRLLAVAERMGAPSRATPIGERATRLWCVVVALMYSDLDLLVREDYGLVPASPAMHEATHQVIAKCLQRLEALGESTV
jgi:hypothetical protein